jgi:hypothetical protein
MTNASGQFFARGARLGAAFPLDTTTGLICPPAAQPTATGYYGEKWRGLRAFRGNYPKPRKVTYVGQDRVQGVDWLPPNESMDGVIEVSASDFALMSLLGGQKVKGLGTAKMIQMFTNKQGFEPPIAIHLQQQAEDFDLGVRRWQSYFFPNTKAMFSPGSMTDNDEMLAYNIAPTPSRISILGTNLTEAADGTTVSQMGMLMSINYAYLVVWRGDGIVDDFLLDPTIPALDTTTAWLGVTKNGVAVTETQLTTGITFAAPPADGDLIIALVEGAGQ